jgi:hypothetical protein
MDTAMANEFPPAACLPAGRAPSVARKSPTAARITEPLWRQNDDADSDGGTERRPLEDRRDANKLAGLVWRGRAKPELGVLWSPCPEKDKHQTRARAGDLRSPWDERQRQAAHLAEASNYE